MGAGRSAPEGVGEMVLPGLGPGQHANHPVDAQRRELLHALRAAPVAECSTDSDCFAPPKQLLHALRAAPVAECSTDTFRMTHGSSQPSARYPRCQLELVASKARHAMGNPEWPSGGQLTVVTVP